jgi:ATP-dependent Lon protease
MLAPDRCENIKQASTTAISGKCEICGAKFIQQNQRIVGDKDPRSHEFSIHLRSFDSSKSGNGMGMVVLMSICNALLEKNTKGGLVIVGPLNLGGSLDLVYNAVNLAEIAVDKGATSILIPLSVR